MRAVVALPLLASTLLAAVLAAPPADALIYCAVELAEDEYYTVGAFAFDHQDPRTFNTDTRGNVLAWTQCQPLPGGCEVAYANAQRDATEAYGEHGQLNRYGGDTRDNADAYQTCVITV